MKCPNVEVSKMNCPYCNAELDGDPRDYGEFHEFGYSLDLHYWDEYHCECPKCGMKFRWFEDYVYDGQSVRRMKE